MMCIMMQDPAGQLVAASIDKDDAAVKLYLTFMAAALVEGLGWSSVDDPSTLPAAETPSYRLQHKFEPAEAKTLGFDMVTLMATTVEAAHVIQIVFNAANEHFLKPLGLAPPRDEPSLN